MSPQSTKKVAIFPAAGKLGTSVYQHITKVLPPEQIILITRHPDKIPHDLVKVGVEVRKADYNAPESFKDVFDSVSYMFLISYPSIEIEHRFQAHQKAITAALDSSPGIEHVFYTSLGFGGDGQSQSAAYVMQAHLKTEAWLRELVTKHSKLTYTVIREGIYSETWPMYTGFFEVKGSDNKVRVPHDGSAPGIAWACISDLGEASANLVKEFVEEPRNARYINKIVVLSGPKSWSLKETAELLGNMAGKQVSVEQVSFDDHANDPKVTTPLGSHGPGGNQVARDWTTVFEAIRNGETSVVNGELERLLGRPPESFETTVKKMLST
ncbi:hypothetical protein LTR10_023692 [Elasticomyces elasticus]|uniref:NmrA-like domain-containing protein n=1 Tax=Exophiala sideris TaxID=1016849 RepID=A0ABR0JHP9_9EURO|nr:hypothetical protein LTR10_023692 [Elasticomyces elasticus]KAK5033606.1 hypothetical protein LTS07_003911 [Exophiala sideris]KAK5041899.1 hypothetical protein LTR13_001704 [Exophiala sideris]KAK5064150.1 hypothetical protein LTR69_003919 [Exophiala sideris]KAK5185167.1 hypothetical protein LTR44_002155 [Eurotiomycetes sp. CCFEE 6388]